MLVRQLLYFSQAVRGISQTDIKDILNVAREENAKHHITGFLLYVEGFFIRCIEGDSKEIGQLVTNIISDERNKVFTVLLDEEVEKRDFSNWSMGYNAYGISELQEEEGFYNIKNGQDIESIIGDGTWILKFMEKFYLNNARLITE